MNADQLQHETARVAGILLIIGVLHGLNLLALPVIGRILTLNRQLDEDRRRRSTDRAEGRWPLLRCSSWRSPPSPRRRPGAPR